MRTATQTGLVIAQHRIDPLQFAYILGLSTGHNRVFLKTVSLCQSTKTGQTIREDRAAKRNALACPVGNRLELETRHWRELYIQRMTLLAARDDRDKVYFILNFSVLPLHR